MIKSIRRLIIYLLCLAVCGGTVGLHFTAQAQTENSFQNYQSKTVLDFDHVSNQSALCSATSNWFDYSVSESGGTQSSSAFCQTLRALSPIGSYNRIELKLSGDSQSSADWRGASELWFYVDASEYGTQDFKMFLGVKETGTAGRITSFGIREGSCLLFQNGSGWFSQTCESQGYFTVPAGYKGYVRIMLNEAALYNLSGGKNYAPILSGVLSVLISADGNSSALGKSLYVDSFCAVGDQITGETTPAVLPQVSPPVFRTADPDVTVGKNSSSALLDFGIGSVSGYNRYYVFSPPVHGTVSLSCYSGMAVYTPESGYNGTDSFQIAAYTDTFSIGKTTASVTVKETADSDPIADISPTDPEYSGSVPTDAALSVPQEGRAVSKVSDLGLQGYVAQNFEGNIQNWLLEVQEKNPQVIRQIADADVDGIIDISAIMSDELTMMKNGIFSFGVREYSAELGRALVWNNLRSSSEYREMYIKFSGDSTSVTNWTGADEFWTYIDVSEYGTDPVPVGLGFQENNVNADGTLSSGIERWGLKTGAEVLAYDTNAGSGWQSIKITDSATWSGENRGRVILPAGFKGWVKAGLSPDVFSVYYTNDTTADPVIDGKYVPQYQMVIEGTASSAGTSAYVASFGVAGESCGGSVLPVSEAAGSRTFRETWSIDAVSTTAGKKDSAEIWPWYGEFAGKILTGMAYMYQADPQSALYSAASKFADALIAAQKENGYLGIYNGMGVMGGQGCDWDVWNHYHAIFGLYSWYKVSGDQKALAAAQKAADYVYSYFVEQGRSFASAGSPAMNLSISDAFALLYQETGDVKYLNAAKQIVVQEWPANGNWMTGALNGLDYYQTSPRWEALHTVMTLGKLYEATGDTSFYKALENIWWSIVKTDRHNDGGFSTNEQASGDPYASGPVETCCTVAYMALSTEYLQLSHQSLAADELELSFFNAMLGSLMQDDREVTYSTPMDGTRQSSVARLGWNISTGFPDMTCCQANAARGLGQVSQWAVLTGPQSLFLNYYGPCAIQAETPGGSAVTITEDTVYPQNGSIRITLSGLSDAEKFNLCLRIPFWSSSSTVSVNGQKQSGVRPGTYFSLEREWHNGDVIELTLDLSVHYWVGEQECSGKTSVYYGPILMALDGNFSPYSTLNKIVLQTSDLENNLVVKDGSEAGCWLTFDTVTVDNKPVRLIDFASAGQNGQSYISWLNVNSNLNYRYFAKGRSPVWSNTSNVQLLYGDVNQDGKINTTDALLTLRAAIKKIVFTDEQKILADVNGDNAVNTTDALMILKRAINSDYLFPVQET